MQELVYILVVARKELDLVKVNLKKTETKEDG